MLNSMFLWCTHLYLHFLGPHLGDELARCLSKIPFVGYTLRDIPHVQTYANIISSCFYIRLYIIYAHEIPVQYTAMLVGYYSKTRIYVLWNRILPQFYLLGGLLSGMKSANDLPNSWQILDCFVKISSSHSIFPILQGYFVSTKQFSMILSHHGNPMGVPYGSSHADW